MSTRGPYRVVGYKAHSSVKEPTWLVVHSDMDAQVASCLDKDYAVTIAGLLNERVKP